MSKVPNDFLPIRTLVNLGHERLLPPVEEGDPLPMIGSHVLYSGLSNEDVLTI